jgi:stearoyl-CoA desaturase (delta-9 desaturase)
MDPIRWEHLDWPNSLFLLSTLALALTGVPVYAAFYGLAWFQLALFFIFFLATGLSITLGYHRLFAHLAFKAAWPVRLVTLIFGAAAFENSVLRWAADHRKHHKFVDHDEDPYNISKGFFHAHIGWMLSKAPGQVSLDGVRDLQLDPLVRWQHRHYLLIAGTAGFVMPALLGLLWAGGSGALGAFLIAGVARVVLVQHLTFLINSWSHTWGRRPYSSQCTARDNGVLAWLTFGEGYHNFHHAFQYDYRNGVKPWQFDPTKWCIWLLRQVGLARQLRQVPAETILLAEIAERRRLLAAKLRAVPAPVSESIQGLLIAAQERLQHAAAEWERCKAEYRLAAELKMDTSRERVARVRKAFDDARKHLRAAIRDWRRTHSYVETRLVCG